MIELRSCRSLRLAWWLVLALLVGCVAHGDPAQPIPTTLLPAPHPAQRLVVVLPGRADSLADLRASGATGAIQTAWPDADVLLAGLTLDYYFEGDAPQRLHDEVIAPARQRGYREVWLAGASLGGLGSLFYDRIYPHDIDGMVLLAPYLGQRPLIEEITRAGGLAHWDPGPPQPFTPATWQHELWRHLQGWSRDPQKARNVWIAYGDRDKLRTALPLLAPLLPPGQAQLRPGGHRWQVWAPAMHDMLREANAQAAVRTTSASLSSSR